ncbi:MAG: hypothetical protein V4724_23760 [Pseudomonadota bacterium]
MKQTLDQRGEAPSLLLVELDPLSVVDGERCDDTYLVEDVNACGAMREFCPSCRQGQLQLILRQDNVRVAHLFCYHCTRCYGAFFEDGTPALCE